MECGRNQSAAENKNAIATKVKMSWSSCRGPPITKPFNSLLDAGKQVGNGSRILGYLHFAPGGQGTDNGDLGGLSRAASREP
jgi:hypothetical protein